MVQIQRPNLSASVTEFLRLTGRVSLELEPFVIGTMLLADLSKGEVPPLRRHVTAFFGVNPVALEVAIWRWEVPGSVIAVLTRLAIQPGAQTAVRAHFGASLSAGAFPTTVTNIGFTDGRILFKGNQEPAGVISLGTQVAGIPSEWHKSISPVPDDRPFHPEGWILGTGDPDQFGFIEFSVSLENTIVSIQMEWDEFQIA